MNTLHPTTRSVGALLFVRGPADLHAALRAVNALRASPRSTRPAEAPVLGILVGAGFEGALPEPARTHPDAEVTLAQSVDLAGVWSLCWFEARSPSPRGSSARRRWILDHVLPQASALAGGDRASPWRVLFAVVPPSERLRDVDGARDALARRYPTLTIARGVFVDDPSRGGIVRLEAAESRSCGAR
ncbi:MAG: hypothetical protein R3A52_00235 [Polyangiales bacterium]